MTHYDLFKLLHVVGAIAWVGGGIGLLTLNQQIISSRDYATLVTVGRQSQSLGMWLFMPAALVTVVFGVALVATEPAYRFGDLWILVGFGGIVASGIAQMAVAERAGKRSLGLVAAYGTEHPALAPAAHRILLGSAPRHRVAARRGLGDGREAGRLLDRAPSVTAARASDRSAR